MSTLGNWAWTTSRKLIRKLSKLMRHSRTLTLKYNHNHFLSEKTMISHTENIFSQKFLSMCNLIDVSLTHSHIRMIDYMYCYQLVNRSPFFLICVCKSIFGLKEEEIVYAHSFMSSIGTDKYNSEEQICLFPFFYEVLSTN